MNNSTNKLAGLRRFRENTRIENTKALQAAIASFEIEFPNNKWTYSAICLKANLKSQNPIRAPWNNEVKTAIDQHNAKLKFSIGNTPSDPPKSEFEITKRRNIQLEKDITQALSKLAVFDAENNWLLQENESLQKINIRLEKRLEEISAELNKLRGNK